MGAVTYLPYAHAKDADVAVAIWNDSHAIVGHTTGANVTCQLQRPNGLWYKLATTADLSPDDPDYNPMATAGTYFSAALTNLSSLPDGYPWGSCPNNSDQPGRRFLYRATLFPVTLTLLAGLVATGALVRGRRQWQRASRASGFDSPTLR